MSAAVNIPLTLALLAALALGACASPEPLRGYDGGDVPIPELNLSKSIDCEVHFDNYEDFSRAQDKYALGIAHGFTVNPSEVGGRCIIYILGTNDEGKLGHTFKHELAHAEGWPSNHPIGWRIP